MKSGELGLLTEVMSDSDDLLLCANFLMNTKQLKDDFVAVYKFDENKYTVETYLIEHERTQTSATHQWLKEILVNSFRKSIASQV